MENFANKQVFTTFVTISSHYNTLLMKILITGASGFIGSFIVEEALTRGMEVWATIRKSSKLTYLDDKRINLIELDFSSEDRLREQLAGHCFDYVVHAAGVTKCSDAEDFRRVNTYGTINLVNAIINMGMPIKRMVYLSSLSVFGAIKEKMPYEEISGSDTPEPNTEYGRSKLAAENYIDGLSSFPCTTLRPTGVYGPREKDYFLMAKSISRHIDFAVGYKRQDITFVYVKDVVQAVFLALDKGRDGRKYFLSDGHVYRSSDFSDCIRTELGNPWWIRITAPIWVLKAVTSVAERIGKATGKVSALNRDKFNILKQRNWRCDIHPTIEELGYKPEYDLRRGTHETIKWYKENKWL